MDGEIKTNAEDRPILKSWEEYTEEEIDQKLAASDEDILMGRVLTPEAAAKRIMARFRPT